MYFFLYSLIKLVPTYLRHDKSRLGKCMGKTVKRGATYTGGSTPITMIDCIYVAGVPCIQAMALTIAVCGCEYMAALPQSQLLK